ncbi:MAG TPA: glycosyltransferase family 39 protein, partial [Planctomycetota bacterium]|nr:glycosyltransferase family 39 protein [Planctomycetota bacterium]
MRSEAEDPEGARRARRWLVALVAAALALRLPGYLGWWFNPDEAIYLEVATTHAQRARAMVEHNAHPPLQYALLRLLAPLSTSPPWLRLPSLIAGVALVPLVHAAVRRLASPRAALVAAALVAVSPMSTAVAGVMRPYALQQAALALALLGWAGWIAGGGGAWLVALALALCTALGLHYSSFAALAAFGLALLALGAARALSQRRWLGLAVALLPPGGTAVYLYVAHIAPRLEGSGLQAEAREGWLQAQFADGFAACFGRVTDLFEGLFGLPHLALAFAVVALAVGLRARSVARLALPLAALAAALGLSLAGKYPLGGSRHSAWLLVFLAPLVADGVGDLLRARARPLAVAGLAAALLLVAGSARHAVRLSRGRGLGELRPEGTVRPGEVAAVKRALGELLDPEAVVLTDQQSLNLLRAELGSEEPLLRKGGGSGLSRAIVGGRTFLFLPSDAER